MDSQDAAAWSALLQGELEQGPGAVDPGHLRRCAEFHGVQYPEIFAWALTHHGSVQLEPRHGPRQSTPFMEVRVPQPDRYPESALLGDCTVVGDASQRVVDWILSLLTHQIGQEGNTVICFDFDFDSANPPIVMLHGEDVNPERLDRTASRVRFVCDSFLDLVSLPKEPGESLTVAQHTSRGAEWQRRRDQRAQIAEKESASVGVVRSGERLHRDVEFP